MISQAIALARKPHIIVATPGRLVDHLENTKGFNLRQLKYLVMDEADRMLSMDFEEEVSEGWGKGFENVGIVGRTPSTT
jgi:ATP-dependent RNA helicase DDX47/RRP3